MRVAVAQILAGRDPAANLDLVRERSIRAAEAGAELVVFPEATMRAFGHRLTDVAEPLHGRWAGAVRELAANLGIVIIAGMFTPGDDDHVRNTVLATGPGFEAHYDKIHLFDAFDFAESDTITAGTDPVVIGVGGVRVGLATCYDVRFPALFTRLAELGAELIVLPSSWGAGPGKLDQWRVLVRARALDTGCFVIACDQADPASVGGRTSGSAPTGIGHSMISSPLGDVLVALGDGPEMIIADLDLDEVARTRARLPVLANRRI